jgi:flagellar hook-associated protein 1 FlgK
MTSGQIGGYIKMLNSQGEFGTSGSPDDRGLQYYEKMLDTLAGKFAEVMNDCNRAKKLDADGNPLTDADGNYIYEDKLLFEAEGSGTVLAANIKISEAWKNSTGSYITNTDLSSSLGDNSGDTSNILKMIAMFEKDTDFMAENGYGLFTGTFQEFFSNTATTLSLQVENTQDSFETYEQTLYDIENSRQSMSSVDLDEEGVNLLAYSKSYNAAARLMTTLDELLDTLINRMAV